MLYLVVAYDTPSDKRRRRMFRALKTFGERKQFSVFEARVTRDQWARLKRDLEAILNPAEDNLAAYILAPEAVNRTWRVGNCAAREVNDPDFL